MIKLNLKSVVVDPEAVIRVAGDRTADRCYRAALRVEAEAKRLLSVGGKHRVGMSRYYGGFGHPTWVKQKKRIRTEPSAPGDPPHLQTGDLRASVASARSGAGAVVGPTQPYGKVHEWGGRHHPKRPFMRPALENVRGQLVAVFRGLLAEGALPSGGGYEVLGGMEFIGAGGGE